MCQIAKNVIIRLLRLITGLTEYLIRFFALVLYCDNLGTIKNYALITIANYDNIT